MVLKKCESCNKNITKKSPGLECSRCKTYFHAKTNCAKLTNKQLEVLETIDGLEWSCKECLTGLTKRSSYFLPAESDSEEKEENSNEIGNYDNLVSQLNCDTRKILKCELKSVMTSMERMIADLERNVLIKQEKVTKILYDKISKFLFVGIMTPMERMTKQIADLESNVLKQEKALKTLYDKYSKCERDSVMSALERMTKQIADLENNVLKQEKALKTLYDKNSELVKKNKTLELRVCAREQTIQEADQKLLCTSLEVIGTPESNYEDPLDIIKKLAEILKVSDRYIVNVRRSSSLKKIVVEFHSKGACEEWIESAKGRDIMASSICTYLPAEEFRNRVFVKPILTQQTKILLSKTKISLGNSFKYIWVKNGKIYVKKDDDSEFNVIRNLSDIESLCKPQS